MGLDSNVFPGKMKSGQYRIDVWEAGKFKRTIYVFPEDTYNFTTTSGDKIQLRFEDFDDGIGCQFEQVDEFNFAEYDYDGNKTARK